MPSALLGIFGMRDALVLEIGTALLHYLAVSGFFVTVALIYTGALQGTGDTKSPFYISLVSQIVRAARILRRAWTRCTACARRTSGSPSCLDTSRGAR